MTSWGFECVNNPNGCVFVNAPDYAVATERMGKGYRLITTVPISVLREMEEQNKLVLGK
jgi:hypothetical protein